MGEGRLPLGGQRAAPGWCEELQGVSATVFLEDLVVANPTSRVQQGRVVEYSLWSNRVYCEVVD